MVAADLRTDSERRRALVVEGAEALESAQARALEGDVAVHYFLDIGALAYFVDIFTFDQASHVTILVAPRGRP
ncbi:hypothetical protein GCM10023346_25020 [Arthrobacter gyeryongensis]|uniref:Uncharacterized protein n=1 Tax=Arthrobacter gyeryongensis TaxID=1650592 RepID=A0ABP9SIN7_9MICC